MTITSSSFTSCCTKQPSPVPDDPTGDPRQWSVDDVCRWAAARPLVAPAESNFRRHAVDGHVLINYVTNVTLAEELDVSAFGTRVYVLEAVETLRWNLGLHLPFPRPSSCTSSSSVDTKQHRSLSNTPEESDHHSPLSIKSAAATPTANSKRSASRIADAEKKRQKRAEMKKNPILYAEYLRKERERNARRRQKQRLEKGINLQQQHPHSSFPSASGAGNDSITTPSSTVILASPLIPPVHNIRQTAAISDKQLPQQQAQPPHPHSQLSSTAQ